MSSVSRRTNSRSGGKPRSTARGQHLQPAPANESLTGRERDITIEFLRLVNESTGTRDLIRAVTAFFQQQSGCEAVGVRLREGEDYPYFETRGFPQKFVRGENKLCAMDGVGGIVRDSAGNPVLDCMCGNVICGRFDPAKPFFTGHGSFWTNSTTQLLATTTDEDRQARTRNRCHGEGYESVALIPLRLGEQRLGLLQLNDRRTGVFTPELMSFWERLADQLAVAVAKFRADEELRESEARFRSLFENMAEGFAYCLMIFEQGQPRDFIYLAVNKTFESLTGLKDVVGRKVSDVIPGLRESDPLLFEVYARVAATGQPEKFETYVKALKMWFSISVYCPAAEHFVAVFDVITARKEAEQVLREQGELLAAMNTQLEQRVRDRTAQLEAAVKELEAFSYSVSHDLRAPLRAIDGFANILVEDHAWQLGGEGVRVLDVIRKEAARMGQLINDLLAFSRIGRSEMQSAAIDMNSLAQAVFDECAARVPERRLQLKLDRLLPACGDPSLIRQVLTNLLSNAVKYSKPRELAEIELGSRTEGKDNVYWVKDNGVGFDPRYRGKLFGIFQRLHSDHEFEGTGVGLALVQRIVHRHGGRVWGEGKLNEGAAFFFTLPRSRNNDNTAHPCS